MAPAQEREEPRDITGRLNMPNEKVLQIWLDELLLSFEEEDLRQEGHRGIKPLERDRAGSSIPVLRKPAYGLDPRASVN